MEVRCENIILDDKSKLMVKLGILNLDNVEKFYTDNFFLWLITHSETEITDSDPLRFAKRVFPELYNLKGHVVVGSEEKNEFIIKENGFIEEEINELNKQAKHVDFRDDLNLKHKFDYYLSFLEKRLKKIENPEQVNNNMGKTNRVIDIEKLKKYFTPIFKGRGNGINNFEQLIVRLEIERTAKEFAQISLMCYESNYMSVEKPKTWNTWYKIFCDCVGCKKSSYDNKNTLRNSINKTLERDFCFLQSTT